MDRAEKVTLFSALYYLLLAAVLFIMGYMHNSKALVFGGLLVVARLLSEAMVFLGMRYSTRRSKNFPFGLYKLENLVAAVIGAIILLVAYELAKYSFFSIPRYGIKTGEPQVVMPVLAVCAAAALIIAFCKKRVGGERNSPGLIADARNSFVDMLVLCVVIIGMGLEVAGVRWMEEVVLLLASVYMLWVGSGLVYYSIKVLLDASVERSVLEKVKSVAYVNPLVTRVLDVRGTNSANRNFIDISVVLLTTDLREAKEIAVDVENRIVGSIPAVEKVNVQFEARPREFELFAVPVGENCGLSDSFENAPFFSLVEARDEGADLSLEKMIPNPVDAKSGRGVRLIVALDRLGVNRLLLRLPAESPDVETAAGIFGISIIVDENLDATRKIEELVTECAAGFAGQGG